MDDFLRRLSGSFCGNRQLRFRIGVFIPPESGSCLRNEALEEWAIDSGLLHEGCLTKSCFLFRKRLTRFRAVCMID